MFDNKTCERRVMRIILSLTCILLACAVDVRADALTLTGENTVIVSRGTYDARWLQYYLIEAVAKSDEGAQLRHEDKTQRLDPGATTVFPVVKAPVNGNHAIVVGTASRIGSDYLTEAEVVRINERPGTVLIRRQGNDVVVATSASNPWDFSHIRIFLDKAVGVRLYAPGRPNDDNLWLSKPAASSITIETLDIFQRPYFAKTAFSSGAHERNREWERMNTPLSESNKLRASHTIYQFFPPDKYYDKYPQLYPMNADGSRPKPSGLAWNPCFADPDLAAKVAMEVVREKMNGPRKPTYLSFGVMDCHYECKCDVCQASMAANNGNAGRLWYDMLNRVAQACAEEYPQLYLTSYEYVNIGVPTDMTIEPNIVIDVVTKSYRFIDPRVLDGEKRLIQEIAGTGASWITHDWDFSGVTPRLYNRQWASFLQWAAANGMKGIYVEWSPGEQWYLDGCKYWLLRQLMSDPYQDVDNLWKQYCTDMYGRASETMYRFYQMFAQKHVYYDRYYSHDDLPRREMAGFTAADLAQQRALLEQAMVATRDDVVIQQRITHVMRYFRGHELWAQAVGVPARAYHRHTTLQQRTDVNDEALAFYVNDDGSTLIEAIRYYDEKRTIEPDSHPVNTQLGSELSYRANYSRALGTILTAIRGGALASADLSDVDAQTVRDVTKRAVAIYREHLPQTYNAQRGREIEALFRKILWIPRVDAMPTIDGSLDDDAWSSAAELTDFTLADLILPSQAGNVTRGRIARVGDHLVLGVTCDQPGGVWAETTPDVHTGTRIWRESCCEFFFGPQPEGDEKPQYFQYIVNSLGAFRGFQTARDNRQGVQCAVARNDAGRQFTIEVALPLKVEGQYDYSAPGAYNFTIMRQVYNGDTYSPPERLGWHPMFFTAHNIESRGLVFME